MAKSLAFTELDQNDQRLKRLVKHSEEAGSAIELLLDGKCVAYIVPATLVDRLNENTISLKS